MAAATIKGFIAVRQCAFTGKSDFHFFNCKMDEVGYITVMPYEFTVDVPDDFNINAEQVKCLHAMKEILRREFDQRVMAINEEISKLQCIEFDPKVPA